MSVPGCYGADKQLALHDVRLDRAHGRGGVAAQRAGQGDARARNRVAPSRAISGAPASMSRRACRHASCISHVSGATAGVLAVAQSRRRRSPVCAAAVTARRQRTRTPSMMIAIGVDSVARSSRGSFW